MLSLMAFKQVKHFLSLSIKNIRLIQSFGNQKVIMEKRKGNKMKWIAQMTLKQVILK